MTDVERLLRSALVPIEPPQGLTDRLDRALTELTDTAAQELAGFEPEQMRDPRNWGRPLAAAAVVGVAGGALALVRARQQARKRQTSGLRALEHGLDEVVDQVRKRLER